MAPCLSAADVTPALKLAQRLALGIPAVLLAGAYISEYGFGLFPCEMCWWQRYPHFAAIVLALISTITPSKRLWIGLAAGVEYGWWKGITGCTSTIAEVGGDPLAAIMNAPLVRCDVAPWTMAGVSLAGFNAIISVAAAVTIWILIAKDRRA